jgi:hypothetical protein
MFKLLSIYIKKEGEGMSIKKKWAFIVIAIIAVASMVFLAGCGGSNVKGKIWENEKFSVLVPDGWETVDYEGGIQIQLLDVNNPFVMVITTTKNEVTEAEVKAELEEIVKSQNATPIEEVTMLGSKFFKTTLKTEALDQTVYTGLRNGEEIDILLGGNDHKNNKEMKAMLESIKFKF